MELPEKTDVHRNDSSKYAVVVSLLLIILILCIAFLVYLKNQGLSIKELNINELFSKGIPAAEERAGGEVISEFKYTREESVGFGVYDGLFVRCGSDGIRFLDEESVEQWSKPLLMNKPMVKSSGSYLLVADSGGKDIYLIKGRSVRWNEKLENAIINADVNKKGFVSVVTEKEGYKGEVIVYDSYGNWMFTTVRAEDFILSARVLASSQRTLITTVNTSGDAVKTNLEFVDMHGETQATVTAEDEIVSSAVELGNGWVVAAGSKSVLCINSKGETVWKHSFDRIYSITSLSGNKAVAAVRVKDKSSLLDSGKTYIKMIDTKGKVSDIYSLESDVVNLREHGGIIAVNTGEEVHFINSDGEVKAEYEPGMTVEDVFFMDKNKASVVLSNSVAVVDID